MEYRPFCWVDFSRIIGGWLLLKSLKTLGYEDCTFSIEVSGVQFHFDDIQPSLNFAFEIIWKIDEDISQLDELIASLIDGM